MRTQLRFSATLLVTMNLAFAADALGVLVNSRAPPRLREKDTSEIRIV